MSNTVFLDPVAPDKKSVLVRVRNTSDHPELDLKPALVQALQAKGYAISDNPDTTNYMLQVNVVQAGPFDPASKNAVLAAGYGQAFLGAGLGAVVGANIGNGGAGNILGGAAVGGLLTFAANQMVKDVYYSVVTDIQLSERPRSGSVVQQHTTTIAGQGNGGGTRALTQGVGAADATVSSNGGTTLNGSATFQNVDEVSQFKQYQLRDVAYANQVNLDFPTAVPLLQAKLSGSIAGLFD